jgi:hypothetical protein
MFQIRKTCQSKAQLPRCQDKRGVAPWGFDPQYVNAGSSTRLIVDFHLCAFE